MAFGVLLAARDAGVRVPDQLSVIGVDDHDFSELVGLTTLAQPVAEQGALGARLVLAEVAGDAGHRRQHVLLPVVLRERVTTASLPVSKGGAVT
jgi:DNA-binding LacI/PurR family transcriptional regulator